MDRMIASSEKDNVDLRMAVQYAVIEVCGCGKDGYPPTTTTNHDDDEDPGVAGNVVATTTATATTTTTTMSPQAIVALSELTFLYATCCLSKDLVAFSDHANRKKITEADVKLVVRKNPVGLLDQLDAFCQKQQQQQQQHRQQQRNSGTAANGVDHIEDRFGRSSFTGSGTGRKRRKKRQPLIDIMNEQSVMQGNNNDKLLASDSSSSSSDEALHVEMPKSPFHRSTLRNYSQTNVLLDSEDEDFEGIKKVGKVALKKKVNDSGCENNPCLDENSSSEGEHACNVIKARATAPSRSSLGPSFRLQSNHRHRLDSSSNGSDDNDDDGRYKRAHGNHSHGQSPPILEPMLADTDNDEDDEHDETLFTS